MGIIATATKTAAPAPAPQQPRKAPTSFGASRPQGSRDYLQANADGSAGRYTIKVNRLKRIPRHESKSPQKCESSIVELEVVASNVPECPVGFTAGVPMTDRYYEDIYFREVKGFICALLAAEPEDVDEADWAAVFGNTAQGAQGAELAELQATSASFIGHLVDVVVKAKPREGKHAILQYYWTPNKEQHPEV